jgi:hypothetical protein
LEIRALPPNLMKPDACSRIAIGGEFETDRFSFGDMACIDVLTNGLKGTWTLSGRSALMGILRHLKKRGVTRVHLPAYLCGSILEPVQALGLEYDFYPVDEALIGHPDPKKNDAVLLVHYFGRINPAVQSLRSGSGNTHYLIEDACQALLSDWPNAGNDEIFYILSPRKFGPVPLGGWCNVSIDDAAASSEVLQSADRSLVARGVKAVYLADAEGGVESETEAFYLEAFERVESSLSSLDTSTLPDWILRLIAGIDWEAAGDARVRNQNFLSSELEPQIAFPIREFGPKEVPLGQPIVVGDRDKLRQSLAEHRIFCPIHWRLPDEVSETRFPEAHVLSSRILTLPIDQRYTMDRMAALVETVRAVY